VKKFKLLYADNAGARASRAVMFYRPTCDIRRGVGRDLRMPRRMSATIALPARFRASRSDAVCRIPLRAGLFPSNLVQKSLHRGNSLGSRARREDAKRICFCKKPYGRIRPCDRSTIRTGWSMSRHEFLAATPHVNAANTRCAASG